MTHGKKTPEVECTTAWKRKQSAATFQSSVKSKKLLEVGCGTGHWSRFLGGYGFEVYNDLSGAAIEARQKAALDPEIIKSGCRVPYAERNN